MRMAPHYVTLGEQEDRLKPGPRAVSARPFEEWEDATWRKFTRASGVGFGNSTELGAFLGKRIFPSFLSLTFELSLREC